MPMSLPQSPQCGNDLSDCPQGTDKGNVVWIQWDIKGNPVIYIYTHLKFDHHHHHHYTIVICMLGGDHACAIICVCRSERPKRLFNMYECVPTCMYIWAPYAHRDQKRASSAHLLSLGPLQELITTRLFL